MQCALLGVCLSTFSAFRDGKGRTLRRSSYMLRADQMRNARICKNRWARRLDPLAATGTRDRRWPRPLLGVCFGPIEVGIALIFAGFSASAQLAVTMATIAR